MSKAFVFERFDIEVTPDDPEYLYQEVLCSDGVYVKAEDAINRNTVLLDQVRVLEVQLKEVKQRAEKGQ